MSSGNILLVDDVRESRAILSLILQSAGYEVTEISSGQELLDLPQEHQQQFDLVLLDVRMPDIDGYTLCSELKNRNDNLPVIFLSALHNASDKIRGLETVAVDFIEKGFDRHELLARINTQLTLSRLRKQLTEALATSRERERQIDEDLEAAAAVQSVILASQEIEIAGLDASSHHLAHSKITGDTYNIVSLSNNYVAASLANSLQPHTDYLLPKGKNSQEIIEPIPPTQLLTRLDEEYPIDRFGRY